MLLSQLQDNRNILAQSRNVVLQSIPAHAGIHGNEVADRLAKEGSRQPQPNPPVSYMEAKTLLKSSFRVDWKSRKGGYSPDQDHIHSLNRREQEQTVIFRLRKGHCGLNKHMKRMGLVDTASCPCGTEEQTPQRILQGCTHLEELRRKKWSAITPIDHKLWGTADELRKTVQLINTSGQRI